MARLAVYTFGILHEAWDHPRTRGFADRVPTVFGAAEVSSGFVARNAREPETNTFTWGDPASPRFFVEGEHAGAPAILSLWDNLESVFAFSYYGVHGEALSKRKEWFVKPEWPTFVCWWVADDHQPTFAEAVERHEKLADKGPTPFAFTFKKAFDGDGEALTVDRDHIDRILKEAPQ